MICRCDAFFVCALFVSPHLSYHLIIIIELLHVKASSLRFNCNSWSRSEEQIRDCYVTMEPGPWTYYRRSSSEPPTSHDSANGFADDEAASDRSEWLTPPGNRCFQYCCLTNALYYISLLLFLAGIILCIVSIVIDRENKLFASILSYSLWLRSDN